MRGWYFSTTGKKLNYGDGRIIRLGRTHKVKGDIALCEYGLHASKRIIDALQYAPGPVIWRVELSGEIIHGSNKSVATERTYLEGGVSIDNLLWDFARRCALDVVHLWDAPEEVVRYLKTGDESLRAAAWAAADAAGAAADAAWDAADAARNAADAAWDAADAARNAARAAAWAAADAAWDAQNRRLTQMVIKAIRRNIT